MADTVHDDLTKVVSELKDANKRFSSAATDFAKVSGGLKTVGGEIAKEIYEKGGLGKLAGQLGQLPFAGIAKSLGMMGINKFKQKREDALLAKQLGLTTKQVEMQRKAFELNKAEQERLEKLKEAAEKLGLSSKFIQDMSEDGVAIINSGMGGVVKNIEDSGKRFQALGGDRGAASALKEKEEEAKAREEKRQALLQRLNDTMVSLKEGMLKGLDALKQKGAMGLGVIAGLVLAPIVALASFFKELAVQVKFLNKLTGGRLAKIFAPIKNFFTNVGGIIAKALAPFKSGKGILGGIGKTIGKVIGFVKSIFRPIIGIAKGSSAFMGGLAPILKFAAGFGRILGKIFLPITILMSVFDFVSGFMDGYDEGGIIGGLEGGITKLVQGLIGFPLNLLKDGIAWIGEAMGFDMSFMSDFDFNKLIGDIISYPFDMIKGAVDWIGTLFTDPVAALQSLWDSIVSGSLIDIIFAPVNKAINWVMGLFGWGDPENPFSLGETIMAPINTAIEWIKQLFSDPLAALQSFWTGLLGGYDSLFSILTWPIDKAINWVMGIFGWSDPDGEEFSLWGLVKSGLSKIWEWLSGIFDIDVGGILKSVIPSWALRWFGFDGESASPPSQEEVEAGEPIGGAALGGQINRPTLVGERGPELFVPNGSGFVTPNNRLIQGIAAATAANINARQSSLGDAMGVGRTPPPVIINKGGNTVVNGGGGQIAVPIPIADGSSLAWNGSSF